MRCFLLLIATVALGGCDRGPSTSNQQPPAKNVLVTKIQTKDVPVELRQYGRTTSPESVDVKPQVSGRITEVHFVEGQDVKKGDLLFVIDPRPFQADLEQAQGQLKSDSAQLALTKRNLDRDVKIGPQHFISEQQIDIDRTNVENLEGATARDQAAIDVAKLNLEYCFIRSPGDGRTGRRLVDPGNYVATGAVTLVNIQRQDPVYVDFAMSENDLARLRQNLQGTELKVDVISPSQPDVVKSGKLTFLDNSVSTQAGTVLLRATIPNSDHYLWPGQYVNVALTLQVLKNASVVPAQTVQMGGKGPYLFAVKPDDTVEQRQVTQGVRFHDLVVISDGAKPGETVVVEGQLSLGTGMKVNPKEYQTAPQSPTGLSDRNSQESKPADNKEEGTPSAKGSATL
jgi:multidrug efflux system membrane fusion protein